MDDIPEEIRSDNVEKIAKLHKDLWEAIIKNEDLTSAIVFEKVKIIFEQASAFVRGLMASEDRQRRYGFTKTKKIREEGKTGPLSEVEISPESDMLEKEILTPEDVLRKPVEVNARPEFKRHTDLPTAFVIRDFDGKLMMKIRENEVLSIGDIIIGSLSEKDVGYGPFYALSNDLSLIIAKRQSGDWILKKKGNDGRYMIIGNVFLR